ncbi:MAG: hypothetical protein PHU63_00780 [Candidatus ainarchaeum sp.]|nr:hypothetical protein [Candidatus ainarchaeum sp.]
MEGVYFTVNPIRKRETGNSYFKRIFSPKIEGIVKLAIPNEEPWVSSVAKMLSEVRPGFERKRIESTPSWNSARAYFEFEEDDLVIWQTGIRDIPKLVIDGFVDYGITDSSVVSGPDPSQKDNRIVSIPLEIAEQDVVIAIRSNDSSFAFGYRVKEVRDGSIVQQKITKVNGDIVLGIDPSLQINPEAIKFLEFDRDARVSISELSEVSFALYLGAVDAIVSRFPRGEWQYGPFVRLKKIGETRAVLIGKEEVKA